MLSALVSFSLRFRGVVIALAVLLLGYGLYTLSEARYDVFPEFVSPEVAIQTEAPGLSPEQVEALVTQPIENAVHGLPGIEFIRSNSVQGLSVINVFFESGSDIFRDRQVLAEQLASLARQLPQGVEAPAMTPLTSSTGDLMSIGLTSDKLGLMALRTLADWTVRQKLLALPGVANVSVFGGEVRQLQIQVLPEKLVRHGLGIEEVLSAARRATGVRGAGVIDTLNQRLVLQTEGQALTAAALARTVVTHENGASLTLGDVATVAEAPQPPISAASVMGKPGVILNVWVQYGANTLEVAQRAEQALAELAPPLRAQGATLHPDLFRAAGFIRVATANVRSSLLLGGILVVVVLFLFLFNLRTAAISCAAIPLSLLAAVTVLQRLGFSLNTMTLGGLAIAIGEVVDDAVIDVENILRRLRENRHRASPRPVLSVVFDASLEVRSAVVYATFMVALVFLPLLTMSGLAGRLFAPLGVAYILAILASLGVALTLTPALCLLMLGRGHLPEEDPPLVRRLKGPYRALLGWIERRAGLAIGAVAVLTLAGAAAFPLFQGEFLPEFKEGHFVVHMTAIPGTSLETTQRLGDHVTRTLMELPFVRLVAQRVGRAERDDTWGTHASEFEVDLKPMEGEDAEAALPRIREALSGVPGANFSVNSFLTERVDETFSGYTASVVVRVTGNDLDVLDRKAREVSRVMAKVPGVADLQIQSPPGAPRMAVELKPEALVRWGFAPVDVLEAVGAAYQGVEVGQVYEGSRSFAVSVILDPKRRALPDALGGLLLKSQSGVLVPLKELARVYPGSGRYGILHEQAQRVQTVTCNVEGRPVDEFVAEAQRRVAAGVPLPAGVLLEFGGSAEAQHRAQRDLLVHSAVAGAGIVLLLAMAMRNGRNLVLVLANLPFALLGGVIVVLASGGAFSMGSMVGFVTLFGITLRNSIMMISHYEHLVGEEGMPWGLETALRGASERLAPILMTALVTGLGLLPMALGGEAPGREVEGPLAMVILGGLVTSTVLNLLLLPALALRFGRFGQDSSALPS